jgi:hypothetical protein
VQEQTLNDNQVQPVDVTSSKEQTVTSNMKNACHALLMDLSACNTNFNAYAFLENYTDGTETCSN